jgi:MSHA biogenesis protein MshJ
VKQLWSKWVQQLDALTERERVLIFLAGTAVLLAVSFLIGIEPALKQRRVLAARMVDEQAQLVAVQAQKEALTRKLAQDPDALVRGQIAEKQRQIAEIDTKLAGLQRTLVAPERMPVVLEELVGRAQGVRLVSLHNLPAAPLVEKPAGEKERAPAAADKAGGQHVYKHGVEVVVEGHYLDLLAYVARLERQPWQVYWGKTEMSADYPKVLVSLTLYTLSLDKSWLVV